MTVDGSKFRKLLSSRHDVLEELSSDWKSRPELDEELDYSRSTIDRAIEDLHSLHCIERQQRRFKITHIGSLALEEFNDYRRMTDSLLRHHELLNRIPLDEQLSPHFLRRAEFHSAIDVAPDTVFEPVVDLLDGATALRGTAPIVFNEYFEIIGSRIQDENLEFEVVLANELMEVIRTHYSEELSMFSQLPAVEILVTDTELHQALWLIDHEDGTYAGITVYDDGAPIGSIVNDTEPALEWARTEYDRYKIDASPVHLP